MQKFTYNQEEYYWTGSEWGRLCLFDRSLFAGAGCVALTSAKNLFTMPANGVHEGPEGLIGGADEGAAGKCQ